MRLYLSSFDFGNRPEELVKLVGDGRRAVIVMNALDNFPDQRSSWLQRQTDRLAGFGFDVKELDLREYFEKQRDLIGSLQSMGVVWINGGNTFILRRAMRQSGFDSLLRELLALDRIVYAGFSAATVIAAPDLHSLEFIDDPSDVPAGYDPKVIWDGLRLVDFSIAVHFKSEHAESALVDDEVAYYERHGVPYMTLRDGEALLIHGERQEIVG